jgi:hypothetical protein
MRDALPRLLPGAAGISEPVDKIPMPGETGTGD